MGVLGDQPPRKVYRPELGDFLAEVVAYAKKYSIPVANVIAANNAIELQRQNDLTQQDGDYRDEQMGGLGDRLTELANGLSEMASAIRDSGAGK